MQWKIVGAKAFDMVRYAIRIFEALTEPFDRFRLVNITLFDVEESVIDDWIVQTIEIVHFKVRDKISHRMIFLPICIQIYLGNLKDCDYTFKS